MSPIRVLIADDQPGMRLILAKILEKNEDFVLVGEASDGQEALELFEALRPQVVFLDVEMPRVDGLECGRQIADMDPTACLIYATAHDGYRREAFEVYAFDYLVKPFKVERVNETLERILHRASVHESQAEARIEAATAAAERRQLGLAKLVIRQKESVLLLNMEDIILVQREDRATVIYTAKERIVTSDPLNDIMDKLDKRLFFRSHKSYIINLSMISQIFPYGRWTYVVAFRDIEQDALITHDKFTELENFFL